jgi:hypothetical protein
MPPPSSGSKNNPSSWYLPHDGFLLGLFDPEVEGDMLFRNVDWLSTDYTTLYLRTQTFRGHRCEKLKSYRISEIWVDNLFRFRCFVKEYQRLSNKIWIYFYRRKTPSVQPPWNSQTFRTGWRDHLLRKARQPNSWHCLEVQVKTTSCSSESWEYTAGANVMDSKRNPYSVLVADGTRVLH